MNCRRWCSNDKLHFKIDLQKYSFWSLEINRIGSMFTTCPTCVCWTSHSETVTDGVERRYKSTFDIDCLRKNHTDMWTSSKMWLPSEVNLVSATLTFLYRTLVWSYRGSLLPQEEIRKKHWVVLINENVCCPPGQPKIRTSQRFNQCASTLFPFFSGIEWILIMVAFSYH